MGNLQKSLEQCLSQHKSSMHVSNDSIFHTQLYVACIQSQ